jgi:hypothetical protein
VDHALSHKNDIEIKIREEGFDELLKYSINFPSIHDKLQKSRRSNDLTIKVDQSDIGSMKEASTMLREGTEGRKYWNDFCKRFK